MWICWYTVPGSLKCTHLLAGVLVCWRASVLVCWCAGVPVCWRAGVLVCWRAGVLVCWRDGVLANRVHIRDRVRVLDVLHILVVD